REAPHRAVGKERVKLTDVRGAETFLPSAFLLPGIRQRLYLRGPDGVLVPARRAPDRVILLRLAQEAEVQTLVGDQQGVVGAVGDVGDARQFLGEDDAGAFQVTGRVITQGPLGQ